MTKTVIQCTEPVRSSTDELVRQYLPLVKQVSSKYSRLGTATLEDLIQIGCIGLLKAIRYYDDNREHKASFRSFAIVYIKGEIRHFLRDHGSLVQVPRKLSDLGTKISQTEEALTKELERVPTPEEIAFRLGASAADIREAQISWDICNRYECLEAPDDDDGHGDSRALSEMVADHRSSEQVSTWEERQALREAVTSLGEKARQIVEFVYFYDLTQKQTANLLGLSEMGVSRTLKSAVSKLREILSTEIL